MNGLTEALHIEWREHDIHVTAIKPPIGRRALAKWLTDY